MELQGFTFENWPKKFDWVNNYKKKKFQADRLTFLLFEKHFGYLKIKDRAKKIKVTTQHYYSLRRKYKPYTQEEWFDEEVNHYINDYIVR